MKQLIFDLLKDLCFFVAGITLAIIGIKLMWIAVFGGSVIIEVNKWPK